MTETWKGRKEKRKTAMADGRCGKRGHLVQKKRGEEGKKEPKRIHVIAEGGARDLRAGSNRES